MKLNVVSILILVFVIAVSQSYAEDVEDIVENVQETYDDMDYLTASFQQVETFQLTGSKKELTGKIYVSHGEKYRFESDLQTIVTDGDTIWSYSRSSNQVLIDRVRENSSALLPRDILFKYPKTHYATLLGEEKLNEQDVYVVKLDPKDDVYGYVKSVKLWIDKDDWYVWQIEATEMNDNKTLFRISDMNTEKTLPDSLFIFHPSENMEVVDRR